MHISLKSLEEAVSIRRQIDSLQKRLNGVLQGSPSASSPRSGRQRMSAATRAKLSAATRARWAKQKAGGKTGRTTAAVKKGGITPAGRKRLSQLMKARWVARRKTGKK